MLSWLYRSLPCFHGCHADMAGKHTTKHEHHRDTAYTVVLMDGNTRIACLWLGWYQWRLHVGHWQFVGRGKVNGACMLAVDSSLGWDMSRKGYHVCSALRLCRSCATYMSPRNCPCGEGSCWLPERRCCCCLDCLWQRHQCHAQFNTAQTNKPRKPHANKTRANKRTNRKQTSGQTANKQTNKRASDQAASKPILVQASPCWRADAVLLKVRNGAAPQAILEGFAAINAERVNG